MIPGQVTVRLRLAIGATSIVVSTLMMAVFVGVIPDKTEAIINGRSQLCEAIAIYNSTLMIKNDLHAMQFALEGLAKHNSQIRSVGIRRADGEIVFATNGEGKLADYVESAVSTVDRIRVPLMMNGKAWGNVEVAFEPLVDSGFMGTLQQPWLRLPMAVGSACCVFFWFYLGRTLKQLDPSSAVPGRVREALDGLAESLIVVDQKGVVRFANRVFTELVGITREKMVGRSMARLPWLVDHAKDTQDGNASGLMMPPREMPWQISQREHHVCIGEMMEIKAADDSVRTLNVSCSPVLGPDGTCRGVMICGDDVTHLEDIKKQLHLAKNRADDASAAKSAFVANMSHEIRTPLNAVLGFADVLRRGMAQSREEEIEYLDLIHRSGRHLLELINNILDLSKIESGHLQLETLSFAPHRIVHDVVSVLRARARERGIDLVASYDSALPDMIDSDPTKLRQIVTNLVGNALKFTEVGCVTVHTSATGGLQPRLRIDVQDTGIGMTPMQQEKIFVAFEQADGSTTRRFGGTGLGLSISKQFAEALGGTLTVSSKENVGSTFTLELPFPVKADTVWTPVEEIKANIERQQIESDHAPKTSLQGLSILVADDGEANRRLISLILSRAGAIVKTACDGREALRLMADFEFQTVLMDMQMPIVDGYEATELIRSTGCQVPIIALTGNAMKGDRQRCLDSGCSDFLTKPVNVDRLLMTVSKHTSDSPFLVDVPKVDRALDTSLSTQSIEPKDVEDDGLNDAENSLLADVSSLQQFASEAMRPVYSSLPTDDAEMAEIVCEFVPRMKERITQMRAILEANHFQELKAQSHWLKGSAATTGFSSIATLASHLEVASGKREGGICAEALRLIEDTVERIELPSPQKAPVF